MGTQRMFDAANARRQQAHAEWFPRLFLNGLFGRENVSINGASLGAARFTNVFGLLAMPLFNAGRTQAINDIADSNPARRIGTPDDMAGAVLFAMTNTFMTGVTLKVDGGEPLI